MTTLLRRVPAKSRALLEWVSNCGLAGLDIPSHRLRKALAIESHEWGAELDLQDQFFVSIGQTLPAALETQLETVRMGIECGEEKQGCSLRNRAA